MAHTGTDRHGERAQSEKVSQLLNKGHRGLLHVAHQQAITRCVSKSQWDCGQSERYG